MPYATSVIRPDYALHVDDSGNFYLDSEAVKMPALNWLFLDRPYVRLEQLIPKQIEQTAAADALGDYAQIAIRYHSELFEIASFARCYAALVSFHLSIRNICNETRGLALFNLLCRKPQWAAREPRMVTYGAGMRPLNVDYPTHVPMSPLMPQLGVIRQADTGPSLIVANMDGRETLSFLLDNPYSGSFSAGFPIEDEFSCGRRKIAPGETYQTDRIMFHITKDTSPVMMLREVRRVYDILFPPRRTESSIRTWWNSWYAYKNRIDSEIIHRAIDLAAELRLDAVEIDDGWMAPVDRLPAGALTHAWETHPDKFGSNLEPLVSHGREAGVQVMLWVWPYMIHPQDPLVKLKPEVFLRRPDGSMVTWINKFVLDPEHPFTAEHIQRQFARYNAQGISGYKVDFIAPLVCMQNQHLAEGRMPPGTWMRKTWQLVTEAIGRDKLIHSSTPMAFAPQFWPFYDIVRVWGDNDPYFDRGLDGYALLPFALALAYGQPTRMDPDMIYPTADWSLLCDRQFDPAMFMDAVGNSFVGNGFYITENCEKFNPDIRAVLRQIAGNYSIRSFMPDRLCGRAIYVCSNQREFCAFARVTGNVEIPAGHWAGTRWTRYAQSERLIVEGGSSLPLHEGDFIVLKK